MARQDNLQQLVTVESIPGMNFTENQLGNAILDKLRLQKDEGHFCDVVLHVQDKTYAAHRNVLAACSPYFESLLRSKDVTQEHIVINCNNCMIFEIVLEYFYTGKVIIDRSILADLLKLANLYTIAKLKGYCSEYLERTMTINNCFWTKEIAEKTGLSSLAKTADAFLLANISHVITQGEVLELSDMKIERLLSNKTLPLAEDYRVDLICRWVRHKYSERQYRFHALLSHIQWSRVNINSIYAIIQEDALFTTSEWCLFHILQALNDNGFLFDIYKASLQLLKEKLTPQYRQMSDQNNLLQVAVNSALGNLQPCQETGHSLAVVTSDMNSQKLPETTDLTEPQVVEAETPKVVVVEESRDLPVACEHQREDDVAEMTQLKSPDVNLPNHQAPGTCTESETKPNEEEKPPSQSVDERERHKRKGIPIKVRIPKSKIKYEITPIKVPKKRGRPPKIKYKDVEKKVTEVLRKPRIKIKQRVVRKRKERKDLGSHGSGEDEDEEEIVDNDDGDADYVPNQTGERRKGADYDCRLPLKKQNLKKREARKRLRIQGVKVERKRRGRKKKTVEKFHCDKCYFEATTHEKLDLHMEKAHKDDVTYSCPLCNFKSTWNREFYQHMRTHFKGPPFKCDYDACDYVADRIQMLLYHRMAHTDERPHACTICNMSFRTRNNLGTHLRCHTGERPFKCAVCLRCFATKGTLEQHSVTHSDHRPYLCDTCGFSTKYQSHLIAHRRIHTGDVFKCQYPNCKYSTPKRSQLACHMRSHMSIRSHICSTCGRGFVEKSHLVRHERIHLDVKPFKCEDCDYSSSRRDKLKEHRGKYHGDDTSPKPAYKPRKSRRQTFDPAVFPGVASSQAEAQLQAQMHAAVQQHAQLHAQLQQISQLQSDQQLTQLQSEQQLTQLQSNQQQMPHLQSEQQVMVQDNAVYNYVQVTAGPSTAVTATASPGLHCLTPDPVVSEFHGQSANQSEASAMSLSEQQIASTEQHRHLAGDMETLATVAAAHSSAVSSPAGMGVDTRGMSLTGEGKLTQLTNTVPYIIQPMEAAQSQDMQQVYNTVAQHTVTQESPSAEHASQVNQQQEFAGISSFMNMF